MKALKEKRVSLRSLFRRSLVILSLLALVFASCGDSNPTDVTNPGDNTGGTNTVEYPVVVSNLTVTKHPINPSFEGAMPDLTGLEVVVTFTKNNQFHSQTIAKAEDFNVSPPVAFISTPTSGTVGSDKNLSKPWQYTIQYTKDGYFSPDTPRVSVYIPSVIAIQRAIPTVTSAGTVAPYVDGKLGPVYEDQGVDAKNLFYVAQYEDFDWDYPQDPTYPADLGYVTTDYKWSSLKYNSGDLEKDGRKTNIKSNPVSSNSEAWLITARDRTSPDASKEPKAMAVYLADLGSLIDDELPPRYALEIGTLYYVESIAYKAGTGKIKKILADNKDWQGSESGGDLSQQKLIDFIKDSDLRFTVTYYMPFAEGATPADKTPTREISMYDYYKAMYTLGPAYNSPLDTDITAGTLTPRASLPYLVGNEDDPKASSLLGSIEDGYTLYLSLYYYNPAITGAKGQGKVDLTLWDYTTPNTALVDLSDYIYVYDHTEKKLNNDTVNKGIPEVQSGKGQGGTNAESVYASIKRHWDLYWVYKNAKTGDTEPKKQTWPTWNTPQPGGTVVDANVVEFDDDIVTVDTPLKVLISLEGPESNDYESNPEAIEFDIIMKP